MKNNYNGHVTLVYRVMVLEAIIISLIRIYVFTMSNFILQCTFLNVIKRLRLVYLVGTGTTLTGYSG